MKCYACGKQMREAHILGNADVQDDSMATIGMKPFRYWVRSSRTRWTEMAVYICSGCGAIRCASTGRVKEDLERYRVAEEKEERIGISEGRTGQPDHR